MIFSYFLVVCFLTIERLVWLRVNAGALLLSVLLSVLKLFQQYRFVTCTLKASESKPEKQEGEKKERGVSRHNQFLITDWYKSFTIFNTWSQNEENLNKDKLAKIWRGWVKLAIIKIIFRSSDGVCGMFDIFSSESDRDLVSWKKKAFLITFFSVFGFFITFFPGFSGRTQVNLYD